VGGPRTGWALRKLRVGKGILYWLPVLPDVQRWWRALHRVFEGVLGSSWRVLSEVWNSRLPLLDNVIRGCRKDWRFFASPADQGAAEIPPASGIGLVTPVGGRTAAEPEEGKDHGNDDSERANDSSRDGALVAAVFFAMGDS